MASQAVLQGTADALPDAIVLDLDVSDSDPAELYSRLRERVKIPIVLLSARGRRAFEMNAVDADDFVMKPFTDEHLLTRIRMALSRAHAAGPVPVGCVKYKGVSIDDDRHLVIRGRQEIRLTPKSSNCWHCWRRGPAASSRTAPF